MIAGGASWPHWLRGHGDRRQALARRRLRVRGRGRRAHAGAGVDRPRAPRLPRRRAASTATRTSKRRSRSSERHDDVDVDGAGALVLRRAARGACGDIDEARRRRLQRARLLRRSCPTTRSSSPRESYSRAKLALLDGDLDAAERHYRAATRRLRAARPAGHELDVPRHGRRLRRARRRLPGRDHGARRPRSRPTQSLLGGFTGSLLARLGWVLLQDGESARAPRSPTSRRSTSPAAGCNTPWWSSSPSPGRPSLHRIDGRNRDGGRGGHRGAGDLPGRRSRRFRTASIRGRPAGRRRGVLRRCSAAIAAEGDEPSGRPPCSGRPPACTPRPGCRPRRSSPTTSRRAPTGRRRATSGRTGSALRRGAVQDGRLGARRGLQALTPTR